MDLKEPLAVMLDLGWGLLPFRNKKTPPENRWSHAFYHSSVTMHLRALNVNCIHAFFATSCFIRNNVAFANIVDETRDMYEYLLASGAVNDKTKTFGFVEELYGSFVHCKKNLKNLKKGLMPTQKYGAFL
jgi:hypothetical protein